MLGELLGRGGMAEVFSGYVIGSHGFQKPVAIKRLLPELANDHVFVERLIGEAKLLVGMQHGNIVSVLDLARDGDDVFLVMEYVDGPSLRQLLKARGSRGLSLAVSTYIVQAAAAGLEFAHAQPGGAVIHADISPSNLLLTTSGEVRVADFGIARREGNGAGIVEGKWAYMAPEQARGEPLTPRSDVFALGVVLYELITGQHPFGQRVTADERDSGPIRIAPPRVINAHVPPGIDAICMRALAENARDRYSRMQHLIDALVDERFSNGWREGASDLAQAIREIAPLGTNNGPRTQVTDRPVTIVTRSLISQPHHALPPVSESFETLDNTEDKGTSLLELPRGKTPAPSPRAPSPAPSPTPRASSPAPSPPPRASSNPVPVPIPSSGARTIEIRVPAVGSLDGALAMGLDGAPLDRQPSRADGTPFDLQPPRADGTPPEAYRLSAHLLPSPELASVHGGATVSQVIDLGEGRSHKWTFAIFGLAAFVGVIAAVAIQLAPSRESHEVSASELTTHVIVPTVNDPNATSPNPTTGNATTGNATTDNATTGNATTGNATTGNPTTGNATTSNATTSNPTAGNPTAGNATTSNATTGNPTAGNATTGNPPTGNATAANATAANATDANATASNATTGNSTTPTTANGQSVQPSATSGVSVASGASEATRQDVRSSAAAPNGDDEPNAASPRRKIRSLEKTAKKASGGVGYLRVNNFMESPWASAVVDKQRGDVPGANFDLAPGRYTVKLSNPDYKTLSCPVTIVAGRTTRLTIDIAEKICERQQ